MKKYLAIDLGAESGRMILGTIDKETLSLKEIHRFPKSMLRIRGKFHWDIGQIFMEILKGLEKCALIEKVIPESIGIDTWGVDFGLLAGDGTLLGMPFTYRDPRTKNIIQEFTDLLPAEELYNLTGTLLAPYNTLFQLFAAKKSHPRLLDAADDLLFIPDLLTYFLTGNKKTERSFATTSQLYNPFTNEWEIQLFKILGISADIMQEIIKPETLVGYLDKTICSQTGMKSIPIIAVATHDTNSAVSAIPAESDNWAFISSGTWSLMGFENKTPVINQHSYQMNFTNEAGLKDTWHVLKNLAGLWPLQECRRSWKEKDYSYEHLILLAKDAVPYKSFINFDDDGFLNPVDMPEAIIDYLKKTKQRLPESHSEFVRIIIESLALKYRKTIEEIEILKDSAVGDLYITGGGIQNELLCCFTANATGKPTHIALSEGTAAGNILCQALAIGQFNTINEVRNVIKQSTVSKTYMPADSDEWENAFQQYTKITDKHQ